MRLASGPSAKKVYTIDPAFPGTNNKSKEKVFISFIFQVEGEALREIPKVFNGERACRLAGTGRAPCGDS